MKIDKSNYEIWLIDWLDGNLSEKQVEELQSFLDLHPDLKAEFNEISAVSLKPDESTFLNKDILKKSSANLPESQFDYLCVAYLENDLSESQKGELMQIVGQDSERKLNFELIQKAKITPEVVSYKHKNKLLKRTPVQKIVRMSVLGLGAAASIAILISIYLIVPQNQSYNNGRDNIHPVFALNSPVDHNISKPVVNNITEESAIAPIQKKNLLVAETRKNITVPPGTDPYSITITDSLPLNIINREAELTKILIFAQVDLKGENVNNTLIASKSTFVVPYYDEERSNIGRFIAKNFRENFLKKKSSSDSPLKGYELAEAGVTGLNKLLGWEMALDEKNDENGELQSVYFSSKILKFNAPVKKTEPQP